MANATDKIVNLDKRLSALESSNVDKNAPIARISKSYGSLKVTVSARAVVKSIHTYNVCSTTAKCATTKKI